jgi:hypothetical protein
MMLMSSNILKAKRSFHNGHNPTEKVWKGTSEDGTKINCRTKTKTESDNPKKKNQREENDEEHTNQDVD